MLVHYMPLFLPLHYNSYRPNWWDCVEEGVTFNWACSGQQATVMQKSAIKMLYFISCTNPALIIYKKKIIPINCSMFDLDTLHKIKIHMKSILQLIWNEIIASNQHNREKWEASHSHCGQWREIVIMFTPFSEWMCQFRNCVLFFNHITMPKRVESTPFYNSKWKINNKKNLQSGTMITWRE